MSRTFKSSTSIAVAAALSGTVLLSGCSAQWASMSPSIAHHHKAKAAATVQTGQPADSAAVVDSSALITVKAPVAIQSGDLDRGSLVHQLPIGDDLLVVHYWTNSTLPTEPGGGDVIHLSAELKGADKKHAVKVTRFAASLNTSTVTSPVSVVPLADDQGEFVITPPYSYTSALALPVTPSLEVGSSATRALSIRFDLLLETAPGSGSYFRQTVLDKVVLTRGTEGVTP